MTNNWKEIKKEKKNLNLIFIHTPKCGGSYVSSILRDLGIKRDGHNQSNINLNKKYITFTVIREPIERFESFLNYRLGDKNPRNDWPEYLNYVYDNKNITLDEIVNNFQEKDIQKLYPYRTLQYWTKNVDIVITIKELKQLLSFFGYKYNEKKYEMRNVSKKERGKLNEKNKEKLKKIFRKDIEIFNKLFL